MILDYTKDRIIEVYEPIGTSDPLKPVIVEVQAAPPELQHGCVIVLAFRRRYQPETFHVLAFHIVSYVGRQTLLESLANQLDRHIYPSQWTGWGVGPATVSWDTNRLIREFEPDHCVETECDDRMLEIVFRKSMVTPQGGAIGCAYAIGVPLLFSSEAAVLPFLLNFRAELERLIRVVRPGAAW